MENNKNVKKGKRLVKTVGQAKTVLGMLLQEAEKLKLERGIAMLLDRVRNPKLDRVLDSYPELLQEYELERLLSGELEIPDAEIGDVHTAGLFSCLQLLFHFGEELQGDPNPGDEVHDGLRYILGAISSDKLVHDLQLITVEVVYEKFQQKIQGMELTLESARDLEKDLELQEHLELMAWLAMIGLFVESLYTYFNIPDQNLKKRIV